MRDSDRNQDHSHSFAQINQDMVRRERRREQREARAQSETDATPSTPRFEKGDDVRVQKRDGEWGEARVVGLPGERAGSHTVSGPQGEVPLIEYWDESYAGDRVITVKFTHEAPGGGVELGGRSYDFPESRVEAVTDDA